MSSHLGWRASTLVDGQLDHDERDRALAHLARCGQCRAAVQAERSAKAALSGMADPPPPPDLVAALLRMGEPGGPVLPQRQHFPSRPAPAPAQWRSVRSIARPASVPSGLRHPRRPVPARHPGERTPARRTRRVRLAAAGTFAVAAVAMSLAVVGSTVPSDDPGTAVVPPLDRFTAEHARTSSGQPFTDPGMPGGVQFVDAVQR